MTKDNFMSGVNWIPKRKNANSSDADITITANNHLKKPYINITIRANLKELITSTDYIKIGMYKNRLILVEGDCKSGYKVTGKETCDNSYIKLPYLENFEFLGDYQLKHDNFYEYYYIDYEV